MSIWLIVSVILCSIGALLMYSGCAHVITITNTMQGRVQQVAEGAQAPPCLGKIICLCLTHWQIEVKIEVTLRLGTSRLSSFRPI